MSIPVALEDLASVIAGRSEPAYLLTTGTERPRATSASVTVDGAVLRVGAGRRTSDNIAERSGVSLLWPPGPEEEHALLVDGDAVLDYGEAVVTPTSAILHLIRG